MFIRWTKAFSILPRKGFLIQNSQEKSLYKMGNIVNWKTIPNLTKSLEIAARSANNKGTIFEIDTISSRDISSISEYASNQEILLLPYVSFEVIDVKEEVGKPLYVKLKEISVPRSFKVVFWVDNDVENYYKYEKEIELNGGSVIFSTNNFDGYRVFLTQNSKS